MSAVPAAPARGVVCSGLPVDAVRSHGLLLSWQQRNEAVTLPHVITQLEESGVLANLRAAGDTGRRHVGFNFSDSDLYKTLEAVGWEIARTGTNAFDAFLDSAVELLTTVQRDDGYLNSWAGTLDAPAAWEDLTWGHELYCGGHLVQAAVALSRAGRPALLAVACRWADLVCTRFADDGFCGHPEVETALAELYRETGEMGYLDVAARMLDRRGSGNLPPVHFEAPYFQDHLPVREAMEAMGHAVRQLYLDAGVADVAVETGEASLIPALVSRWESAHHTKMHLTGAMGSRHFDESFGDPYELPPDRAYAETCAAIADLHLSWRLLLMTGEARFSDAIERVLFNAIPAAVSASGTEFFYSCPLQLRSTHHGEPNAPSHRVPWYPCACCPPNLARLFASLTAYLVTSSEGLLTVHQHADYDVDLPADVGEGSISVRFADGRLTLSLLGELHAGRVRVRVPSWASQDGDWIEVALERDARTSLEFDASPRFVVAHPHADALRGCVAVMAGQTVYCAESIDVADLEDLAVVKEDGIRRDGNRLVVSGRRRSSSGLYRAMDQSMVWGEDVVDVPLVPFRDWGNRGAGAMRVWLPTS